MVTAFEFALLICIEPFECGIFASHSQVVQHIENGAVLLIKIDSSNNSPFSKLFVIVSPGHHTDQNAGKPVVRCLQMLNLDRLGNGLVTDYIDIKVVHDTLDNFSHSSVVCKVIIFFVVCCTDLLIC